MVVSTESTGPTKSKKKRPAGSKSRRSSSSSKQDAYLYDQPRSIVESRQVVNEEDHLYDVVKPRGMVEDSTYQNLPDGRAVYQNMDDM